MKSKNLADYFGANPWGIKSRILNTEYHCRYVIGIDAGGTKTLVAHIDQTNLHRPIGLKSVSNPEYYEGDLYNSLGEIIRDYLQKYKIDSRETHVCIAGAGPVQNNSIQMSNRPWSINADEILNIFQFKHVDLINDLEAMVYAVDNLEPDHLLTLNSGKKVLYGNIAVIAAGTGLGESIGVYIPQKSSRIAIGTEGGNSDFAPANDLEIDLLKFLRKKKNYISWEDVLSGNGLQNLYEFLVESGAEKDVETCREMETKNPAEVITLRGLANDDQVCRRTLEMFLSIYASEAGNLALKCLPYGGLFIAGGIAPRLASMIREEYFMRRFVSKGRLQPLLETIPVYLVTNPGYGVIGAINFALTNVTA